MRHWPGLPVLVGLLICAGFEQARANEAQSLAHLIDRHVQARLDAEGIRRVPAADDAEFLRRVFLNLHGVVPSVQRAAEFLDSSDPEKRAKLIDELLASPQFGKHLGDVWHKYLISPQAGEQRGQTERFASWLAERFNQNAGWDRIVFELLTASGKMEENPAVTYLIEGRYPLSVTDLTDLTSRYFLGVRLNCAQCHDHPFVAWKRHEYWQMAAFFAQIQTPGRPKVVYLQGIRDDLHLSLAKLKDADAIEGLQVESAAFLGGPAYVPDGQKPHRVALAEWLTAPQNPFFARAMVNRLWWHFFGRGIVNPVDDMHAGNAPSHPELLAELSQRFVESGYDVKLLCRGIVSSQTYQQTSRPGAQPAAEAERFGRMSVKVLSAEQFYDSLVTILGPPAKTAGIDSRLGARYEFCQFFSGEGDYDPTAYQRGIPHALRLMNSPQFLGRNLSALVSRAAGSGRAADEVVDHLFLAILARRPTAAEWKQIREQWPEGDVPSSAYGELAWALLMSSEFSLNH